jgi:glutathione S-transferase
MVCEEKGVSHELVPLEFKQPSHKALHPFLRMPVLEANGIVVNESLAISLYLDENFSGPPLQPDDPVRRARMFQWISSCSHYLYHEVVLALIKESDALEKRFGDFRGHFAAMDDALADSGFLAGDDLSIADLFAAPIIDFVDTSTKGGSFLQEFDRLSAWKSRMWDRPSFAATQA